MGPSTLASCAMLIARALGDRGIDASLLFHGAGLSTEHLLNPNARYASDAMQRIWAASVEATGDPCFGLEIGRRWHPTTFHALGYAALASASLREALGYLVRYNRVVTTGASFDMVDRGAEIDLVLESRLARPSIDAVSTRVAVQAGLAAVATLCRVARGGPVPLRHVDFVQADGGCAARLVGHFGCPVSFGAGRNSMTFLAEDFDAPLAGHNVDLLRLNRRLVVDCHAVLDDSMLSARVRANVARLLPSGTVDQEAVAKALHMSRRTMQRKLVSEGVSFRQLVDETRNRLAHEYLRDESLSSSEIAYLLGFAETSSFSRALRRWKGQPTLNRPDAPTP
jgi:AraC-like DNA-binding protein